MQPEHVRQFVAAAREAYYAPGETVLEPGQGPVRRCCCVRQGRITVGAAPGPTGSVSVRGGRAVPGRRVAGGARRCARPTPPATTASACCCRPMRCRRWRATSAPFADFLERRALHFFELVAAGAARGLCIGGAARAVARSAAVDAAAQAGAGVLSRHRAGAGAGADARAACRLGGGGGCAAVAARHPHAPRHPGPRDACRRCRWPRRSAR